MFCDDEPHPLDHAAAAAYKVMCEHVFGKRLPGGYAGTDEETKRLWRAVAAAAIAPALDKAINLADLSAQNADWTDDAQDCADDISKNLRFLQSTLTP